MPLWMWTEETGVIGEPGMLRCRRAPLEPRAVRSFLVDRPAASAVAQAKMHEPVPTAEMQALVAVQKKDKGRDGESGLQLLTLR